MIFSFLNALFPILSLTSTLSYLAFYAESKDALYKVSLLSILYFLIPFCPCVTPIKRWMPNIFNALVMALCGAMYQSLPQSLILCYKYLITAIGPLYILVEVAQSVGLCMLIGEKVTNWVHLNYESHLDLEQQQQQYQRRERLGAFGVILIYGLTLYISYSVFMMDTLNDWPLSCYWIFVGLFIGMLMMTISAIMAPSGDIMSSGLTSLFLSYIVYAMSQINSMETMEKTEDIHATGAWIQFAFIVIILLSIPPTMNDDGDSEEEDTQVMEHGVWKQTSKMQAGFMVVLLLIMTHVLQLCTEMQSVSENLFWYRLGESVLAVILFQYGLYRGDSRASDDNYYDDD